MDWLNLGFLLKPDIRDQSLTRGIQSVDPRAPFPCPVFPNVDGWMQRTREQGPGSTATVQPFKSVRLPVESAHYPFGHTVRGGVFGNQRGAASLSATDSLTTDVCLLNIFSLASVNVCISQFHFICIAAIKVLAVV